MSDTLASEISPTSVAEDVKLLSEEDTTATEGTDIDLDGDSGTDTEPSETEETEPEETVEEPEAEEEEETEPEEVDPNALPGRPTFKDIKKEYPDFFKKFPAVREAMWKESQYSRVFPTVEDAVQANQVTQVFHALEQKLTQGESDVLIGALKADGNAEKFVDNFLPTLTKVDPNLYLRVVTPLFTTVYEGLVNQSRETGDKNLLGTAQRLSMFLFGKIEPPKGLVEKPKAPVVDPEKEQLKQRLEAVGREKFENFQGEILNAASHELRRTAGIGLDPTGKYNQAEREAILDRMLSEVDAKLGSNALHNREMAALWQQAQRTGLTKQIRDRIVQTYLGRAKPILNAVKAGYTGTKKPSPAGAKVPIGRAVPSKGTPAVNAKTIDWKATSDEDVFNDRVTLRK